MEKILKLVLGAAGGRRSSFFGVMGIAGALILSSDFERIVGKPTPPLEQAAKVMVVVGGLGATRATRDNVEPKTPAK